MYNDVLTFYGMGSYIVFKSCVRLPAELRSQNCFIKEAADWFCGVMAEQQKNSWLFPLNLACRKYIILFCQNEIFLQIHLSKQEISHTEELWKKVEILSMYNLLPRKFLAVYRINCKLCFPFPTFLAHELVWFICVTYLCCVVNHWDYIFYEMKLCGTASTLEERSECNFPAAYA